MLEEHLGPFFQSLADKRFGESATYHCRQVLREFALYLDGRVTRPEDICREDWTKYLEVRDRIVRALQGRSMSPSYRRRYEWVLGIFLRFLARRGLCTRIPLPEKKDVRAVPGYQELLTEYERFLIDHRGLRPASVKFYLSEAARFCTWMMQGRVPGWKEVTADILYDYIRREARRLGHLSVAGMQGALRNFFRFLHVTGRCPGRLDRYLVSFRTYKHSRVPPRIPPEVLYRLFEDVKGDDPRNVRDRALLLLLTLYGLRSGEVAGLTLDDVSWKEQTLAVRRRKSGPPYLLPLHPAVTRALYEYVARVRPRDVPYRELFITRIKPHPHPTGSSLTDTIKDRLHRLGIKFWPHALRHSLATYLINNDCPPEWIQILLGHVRFSSTQIYAKADLAHLAEVADNDGANL